MNKIRPELVIVVIDMGVEIHTPAEEVVEQEVLHRFKNLHSHITKQTGDFSQGQVLIWDFHGNENGSYLSKQRLKHMDKHERRQYQLPWISTNARHNKTEMIKANKIILDRVKYVWFMGSNLAGCVMVKNGYLDQWWDQITPPYTQFRCILDMCTEGDGNEATQHQRWCRAITQVYDWHNTKLTNRRNYAIVTLDQAMEETNWFRGTKI